MRTFGLLLAALDRVARGDIAQDLINVAAAGANTQVSFTGIVNVGILHSLTGTMAMSEITVVQAELMAIQEINNAGGLLGKQVVPIVKDGQSDWTVFKELAENFTTPDSPDYVKAVFGCWTSASRKAVLPVFEANDHQLWYPLQYEGQECSKNIFYTGATPNEQLEPAVDWCMRYKSTQIFLVGSDYVFPRTANQIMRKMIQATGGTVTGEQYLALGDKSNSTVGAIVQLIISTMPNGGVIMNTLNGDSNVQFFHMFYDAGLRADKYPIMSFSITETEISGIGIQYVLGHYAAWNFFMSMKDEPNCHGGFDPSQSITFINNYQRFFGAGALVNDPMEAAYLAVKIWAQAVALAGTFDLEPVRRAAIGQSFAAPEGEVTMNRNHHLSKFVRLGQLQASGQFTILYTSTRSVYPQPWNIWVPTTEGYGCDWTQTQLPDPGFYQLDNIRVGLVHALTGSNAQLEKQHLEAEMAAIKVINRNGGVYGKNVLFTVYNTQSNDATLVSIVADISSDPAGPITLFGRTGSDSDYDSAVLGTKHSSGPPLMFDPTHSFGGQCSKSVVHMGSLINQRLWPALQYFAQRAASASQAPALFFVVVPVSMPSSMYQQLQALIETQGTFSGQAVLSSTAQADSLSTSIRAAMPHGGFVLNLLEDVTLSVALAGSMQSSQMSAGVYPVLYTGIMESDIPQFGSMLQNQYVSQAYFASLGSPANTLFRNTMQEFYGINYVITDQTAAAYNAMTFWANAVSKAESFNTQLVSKAMWADTQFSSPAGPVTLDGSNFLALPSQIGMLDAVGAGFRAQASSGTTIGPLTFWLHPARNTSSECDFTFWVRLLCDEGKGLVDAAGNTLQSRKGAVGCFFCPPGTASVLFNEPGEQPTRVCQPCAAGFSQSNPGQLVCQPCAAGTNQPNPGQAICINCELAKYQSLVGQSSCMSCPSPTTTILLGATMLSDCLCPSGMYNSADDNITVGCLGCTRGMSCPQGSKAPAQARGYYLNKISSGWEAYTCRPSTACVDGPAGAPGVCSGARYGFACQQCPPDHYGDDEGGCRACDSSNKGTLAAAVLASAGVLAFILIASNFGPVAQSPHALTLGMALGQLLTFLQVLSGIQNMNLGWGHPFIDMLDVFKVLSLDMSVFKLQCGGVSDPMGDYLIRIFVPLIALAYLIVLYLLGHRFNFRFFCALGVNGLICAVGQLTLTLFTSLTLSTLTPMHCFDNPNGSRSLTAYPQLICQQSLQESMMGVAIAGMVFYLGGPLTVVIYAVIQYPKKIMTDGMNWVTRFRFLFFRWRSGCHWFGLVTLLRNMVVSIWPMVIPQSQGDLMQLLMIFSVESLFAATLYWQPWRTMPMNYLDFTLSAVLVVILNVGAFATMGRGLTVVASILITVICALVFCAVGCMLCVSMYQRLRKSKAYGMFLTHHKGLGACTARFLKVVLQKLTKRAVFYDVDDLTSFEGIFDAVKDSAALVVLLTGETLCRPWCVGEIVTALQCNTFVVPLVIGNARGSAIDKTQSMSDEELKDLYCKFDELRPFGINVEDIPGSIQEFMRIPPIYCDIVDSNSIDAALTRTLASTTFGDKRTQMFGGETGKSIGEVLLMADIQDTENIASTRVFQMMMQETLMRPVTGDYALLDLEFKASLELQQVSCIMLVLTPKTITSVPAMARLALTRVLWPEARVNPVLVGDSFPFPDAVFYESLGSFRRLSVPFVIHEGDSIVHITDCVELSKALTAKAAADSMIMGTDLAEALQMLFKSVAKFVNVPYANEKMLKISIQQTLDQVVIPALGRGGMKTMSSTRSDTSIFPPRVRYLDI